MALMQAATGAASSANFNATTTAIDLALSRALGAGVISGLTVDGTGTVQAGEALIGHVVALAAATLPTTYVAASTNYVYLQMPAAPVCVGSNGKDAGTVVVNQTGTAPTNAVLLATVVTDGSNAISSVNSSPAGRVNLPLPLLPPFLVAGTSGGALTVDLSAASVQSVTLTGNVTLTLTNPKAGRVYRLLLIQDATGSRTVTWPAAVKWPGGAAPTLTTTPAKTDIVEMLWDGTNYFSRAIGQNY